MAWLDNNLLVSVAQKELDGGPDRDLLDELEFAAIALGAKEPGAMDLWNSVIVELRDVVETLRRENLQLRQVMAEQRIVQEVANLN